MINKKGFIEDTVVTWLAIIAIVIFIVGIPIILVIDNKTNPNKWNDGHCPNDNHEWVYIQAVGHRQNTYYIYACPECGTKIEVLNEPDWIEVAANSYEEDFNR